MHVDISQAEMTTISLAHEELSAYQPGLKFEAS